MRLEEVYIKGFKSFAEGLRLRFKGGITGVVGPNGCGKSNFVDAMRWVLGEQKARVLRAERMQQLIFNGTKIRKPLNMAEVSLLLSQPRQMSSSQHSSIQLIRRIYRSGESEYAINGVPSRLRDITDLLLDTGVSTDAYAIIELKMIEDILSDKEGTRCQLFEQAAGVAKFKSQKREALQKLTHTESDLQRISDLLHELEHNLSTLEKQVEKAARYDKIKKKYMSLRVLQSEEEHRVIKEKLHQIQLQAVEEEAAASKWHGQLHKAESEYTARKAVAEKEEKVLQARQKAVTAQQQSEHSLRQELEVGRAQLKMLEERSKQHEQKLKQQTEEQEIRKSHGSALIQSLRQAEERLEAELKKLREVETSAQQQKLEASAAQKRLEETETQLKNTQTKLQAIRSQYSIKEAQAEGLLREQKQIASTSATSATEVEALQQQQNQLRLDLQEYKAKLEQIESEEQSALQQFTKLSTHHESIRESLRRCEQRLEQQYESAEWLSDMQAKMEGFPEAVQWLRSSDRLRAPLLMEVLELAPKYAAAITTYLSPYAQYFVVKKRAEAETAISLLEQHAKGQAAFFVLEELSVPSSYTLGEFMAAVQVSCEAAYVPLRDFLLAGVEVVDVASRPLALRGQRALLAANGSWILEVGQLRGGHLSKETRRSGWGLLARIQSLEEETRTNEAQRKQLEAELATAESNLQQASLKSIQQKKASLQESLRRLSQEEAVHAARLTEQEATQKRYLTRDAQLSEEQIAIKEEQRVLSQQISELEQLKDSHKRSAQALHTTAYTAQSASERAQEKLHGLQLQLSEQKSEQTRIISEHRLHSDYLQAITEQIETEKQARQQTSADIKKLRAEEAENEAQLAELHKKSEQLEAQLNQAEETYYETRYRLTEQEKELQQLQKKHNHAQLIATELRGEYTRLSEQLTHLQQSIETELGSPQEELLPEAQKIAQEETWQLQDRTSVQKTLNTLKTQLNSVGNVNTLAAESLKEMQQRYQFIAKEREDLLQARATLDDTLQEIEKTVRSRFMKAFTEIQSHFQRVFTSLFSKDDICALRLKDETRPSESEIEIIAQPKGKRPLRIEQLSSGEKALTSLALLVAIYLYKPAPFCILDEVDAPLDDANSEKFNRLIRNLSDQAQFILITHNKHSMRSSDTLYGFTMAEIGVTRVLPVDLRTIK